MIELTLKECCKFQEGYVNPSQTKREYFGGPIKWLRASDLNDSFVHSTEKTLSIKGFESAGKSAYLFQENSIAISKSGTIGRLGILKDKMCGNRAVINIHVNSNIADLKYIFYILKYKKKELLLKAEGSIQKNLYVSALETITLNHRSIIDQIKIASVLSALDAKIELNNRINAELEAMAKTIYDYWFVQFDFPDKNGKPYKTSGGKMVWNEELKREIPEGWEVNRFGEVVIIKNGKDHKHLKSGSFPVYGSGGVMRYVNEYLYDSESILIPRKGSLGNLFYLNQPFWSVDTIFYTQMKFAHSCKYLFYTTQNFNISKMNTGTAVPSMTAGILNNLSLVFPSEDILKRFDDILNPIFKNKDVLIKESEELTSLRDWLLPMLMNGQVRVS